MTGIIRKTLDWVLGSGEHAVTVPPMDGALRPNRLLEEAAVLATARAPDSLAQAGAEVFLAAGATLLRLDADGSVTEIERFASPITALVGGAGGRLAIGLADGSNLTHGPGATGLAKSGRPLHGPTALAFGQDGALYAAFGAQARAPDQWKQDLMARGSSGSVWRIDASGAFALLAKDLAWPNGLLIAGDGRVVVAESWRHRLLALDAEGGATVLLDDLPGYPSRLASTADGTGAWLSVFAPRIQLIEFVLREKDYRNRMMREVAPEHWVAPSLSAAQSHLEPLQGGAVKHLGILKPWAPSRSCGLVIRLDQGFQPVASLHSRADGIRHGVTSCLDQGGRLLVASKGSDAILAIQAEDIVRAA